MATLASQLDPQFQYVTADPKKSTGYNPWAQATALYNKMYGYNPDAQYMQAPPPLTERQKIFQKQKAAGLNQALGGSPESRARNRNRTDFTDIGSFSGPRGISFNPGYAPTINGLENTDFLKWYAAAQDPRVLNDPVLKDYLMETGKNFSKANRDVAAKTLKRNQDYSPSANVVNKYVNEALAQGASPEQIRALKTDLNKKFFDFSRAALEPVSGNRVDNFGPFNGGPLLREWRQQALTEGNLPLNTFLTRDPQNYTNAVLTGYIEGPNPSLLSRDGGMFNPVRGTNASKELGGEDLANDVFEYYKTKSTAGQLGSDWVSSANPFVQQGTFNNQQSFFTPYDYAVTGRFNPTLNKTELANVDPNYWLNQGNLQNVNNQWGFITGQDPFAGVTNPNRLLDQERTTIKTKSTEGGFLDNFFNAGNLASLAGFAFGVPMLSLPSTIGGAADFISSYLGGKKSTGGGGSLQRPVQAPTWFVPGA